MCFHLLPVTGLNLNFVFPEEDWDCKIWTFFEIFVILLRIICVQRIGKVAFGSIQQIWTIIESCH